MEAPKVAQIINESESAAIKDYFLSSGTKSLIECRLKLSDKDAGHVSLAAPQSIPKKREIDGSDISKLAKHKVSSWKSKL